MDIFAHTLWTNVGARGANALAEKNNKKFHINVGWAAFFGIFPDLFAFTIPFIIAFYQILFGDLTFSSFGEHHGAVAGFDIAHYLYQYSHSLVIWAGVFLVTWAISKRPRYELFGWALHILIDIPSHAINFFPTPFLFPLSNYRFPYGIPWSNMWYMIINYSALFFVWGGILLKKYKAKHSVNRK